MNLQESEAAITELVGFAYAALENQNAQKRHTLNVWKRIWSLRLHPQLMKFDWRNLVIH